eukprot:jgi/Psemu1/303906/fgenesh1_kg.128_\
MRFGIVALALFGAIGSAVAAPEGYGKTTTTSSPTVSSYPSSQPTVSLYPSNPPSPAPSSMPSADPTISAAPTINCVNDPDFTFEGKKHKDCAWVAEKNVEKRCGKKNYPSGLLVSVSCPLVCYDECAVHRSESPTLAPTLSFEPSEAPTLSPETTCLTLDKKNFKYKGSKKKKCDWVAEDPDNRCKYMHKGRRVNKFCKSSCNLRCLCVNTTLEIKRKDKKKFQKCKKIKKKHCNQKATTAPNKPFKFVYEFCPARCDKCLLE